MAGELEQLLVSHISQHGPIGFDEFQAHALYAPELGFYRRGGGAGRRRDFLTSPEVGPLFGAVVARALDAWWDDLGRPARYPVVDAGAGPGTLARAILAAAPRCRAALELVLVEVGEPQWATHPAQATSRADLPGPKELGPGPVVVLANELLDNLPVAVVERGPDHWHEVVIDAHQGRLVEAIRDLPDQQRAWCDGRAPGAGTGARIPVQADASHWLRQALALAAGGRVVAFDYARTTPELAALPQGDWLRTYANHGRGTEVLADPGSADITCDVALDQLRLTAVPTLQRSQAEFLRAHGIHQLVAEGQEVWADQGLAGGLAAIAGRSRAVEAEALLDPRGLGGFTVVEWVGAR